MKITLLKSKIHCATVTESDRFIPSVVPVPKDNSVKSIKRGKFREFITIGQG